MNRLFSTLFFVLIRFLLSGQIATSPVSTVQLSGALNPITTAVPFLMISPDSKHGGMGDVGAATDPDVYSTHWNGSKLAFVDKPFGFGGAYTPWLRALVPNINMIYVSGFAKVHSKLAIGSSFRYFSLGTIDLTNSQAIKTGSYKPKEWAVDLVLSYKISKRVSLGIAGRYIISTISKVFFNEISNSKAMDLSLFYKSNAFQLLNKSSQLTAGLAITNVGTKIKYSNDKNFIPANLRLGGGLKSSLNKSNELGLYLDFNKLLVPTSPLYGATVDSLTGRREIIAGLDPNVDALTGMIQSFYDAPGGWREEINEINISSGIEYSYKQFLALRTGYFYESKNKGGRQYLTFGIGYKYKLINIDVSYLIPTSLRNPLQNTWRISLNILFGDTKQKASKNVEKN